MHILAVEVIYLPMTELDITVLDKAGTLSRVKFVAFWQVYLIRTMSVTTLIVVCDLIVDLQVVACLPIEDSCF